MSEGTDTTPADGESMTAPELTEGETTVADAASQAADGEEAVAADVPAGEASAPAAVEAEAPADPGSVRLIKRTTRLQGEVRVPGELRTAAQALWLAAVSAGDSALTHVPPAAAATVAQLARVGVTAEVDGDRVTVHGVGLRGLSQPDGPLELDVHEDAALPALAILSQQSFVSRVRLGSGLREPALQLLRLLARTGAASGEEGDGVLRLDGAEDPAGVAHDASDLPGPVKLGLLTAGLYGDGPTVVRESPSSKDRVDALLKARGVAVEGSRQADPTLRTITLTPAPAPAALDVDVAGELGRALPFVVAALSVRRAEITVRRVMLRSENRVFVDVARQLGAALEIVDNDDGSVDLVVKGSGRLKSTRVADKRAAGLLEHVPLLVALATQTEGEFIIRDVEVLREGPYDLIEHLADLLRRVGAKVGEYSYGLVIDGGRPLEGARIDTRRHAGVAQAFAVVGLVAKGEMEIENAQCVEALHPGFFEQLDALRLAKSKEKT